MFLFQRAPATTYHTVKGREAIALKDKDRMSKNEHGEVIMWKASGKQNQFRCLFPNCDYVCTGQQKIRFHAMKEHGAASVFCVWCKKRRTFLRPDTLQVHVRTSHPSQRKYVIGPLLEKYALIPELWPRTKQHLELGSKEVEKMIDKWWEQENKRRVQKQK